MSAQPGRERLPMPDPRHEGELPLDARDATFAPIEPLVPPAGAPQGRQQRLVRLALQRPRLAIEGEGDEHCRSLGRDLE